MTLTQPTYQLPSAELVIPADQVEHNREAWLKARLAGVSATDLRVLAGHNYQNESKYQIWRNKIDPNAYREEQLPGPDEDARLQLGTLVEPIVRRVAQQHLGVEFRPLGLIRSIEHPILLATPDGQASDGGGLEIKMTSSSELRQPDPEGWRTNDAGWVMPLGWVDQVETQLMVSGWPHVWLAALVVDSYSRTFTYWKVLPNPDYQAYLWGLAQEFWEQVQTNTPPAPEWDADEEEFKARHPVAELMATTVDDLTAREVARLIRDRRVFLDAEKQKKVVSNQLRAIAGDASEVRDPEGNLLYRWSNVKGTVFDQERWDREHPDIDLNSYKKSVAAKSRRLWVPGEKEE